jgi:mono/diheme cytochrome c family protein
VLIVLIVRLIAWHRRFGIPAQSGMSKFWLKGIAINLSPAMLMAVLLTALCPAGAAHAADDTPYKVVDGTKVDANTFKGWQTWRAAACERCHGPNQEGMVGPSLVESLKKLSKDEFKNTVLRGRLDKGMPNFDGSQRVVENIDNLYAYLKGRSDGKIKPGHLQPMDN